MKLAFSHCADEYDAFRPDYPQAAVDRLIAEFGPPQGRRVADVGAGTGRFAALLRRAGFDVLLIEPDHRMLLRAAAAGGRVCASGERLPLPDASLDLITAAQAFHWFDASVALAEFARVLRPGGGLALVWNNRQTSPGMFGDQFETLITRYNPAHQREYRRQDWAAKVAETGRFAPLAAEAFDRVWQLEQDAFVGFTRSVSYIRNALSAEDRRRFEADLRALMRRHFGDGPCRVPLQTQLFWTRRI
jgi:ubiquinone/menaquinone biosynthesis C-methylase UbiE